MIPTLVVLLGTFAVVLLTERARRRWEGAVPRAGRLALSALFLFTGISHFFLTARMAEMVPPPFPPTATVLVTGVLEILGAVGLLVPRTSRTAAWCLLAFLLAVFPANVHAAWNHVGLGGHVDGPSYLFLRAPLQILFLGWTWYFGIRRR
jgi:uncharacterized membrane protein